jgi:hypothetical protein
MSQRFTKAIPLLLFVVLAIALFPLSVRVADPLATRQWDPRFDTRILLLWPDHIELRPVSTLLEVSPRPTDARYSFLIPPERLEWVRERLQAIPPNRNSGWMIQVRPHGSDKQEIRLEAIGDGYYGMIYEASSERIVPLRTRLASPGFVFVILTIYAFLCTVLFLLVRYILNLIYPIKRLQLATGQ